MTRLRVIGGLHASGYRRHTLHVDERLWVEKNCYVDVIIEMLHALGHEPLAAMGFCAAIDFEGDNFTFFKPQHEELRELFGVDLQELNVWRPLLDHATEHLGAGKLISTEADSFWLPDTAGTDYRRNHVKTTIIIAELDSTAGVLGYFHNASYHELHGEDFDRLFRRGEPPDPTFLPLFAELVRIDRMLHRSPSELAVLAAGRLAVHLERQPAANPIARFGERFARDLPSLQAAGLAHYHAWAFSTTRQLGAASELLSLHVGWMAEHGALPSEVAATAADQLMRLSEMAKAFILKGARAVSARKPLDASASFEEMAQLWSDALQGLGRAVRVPT